MNITTPNLTHLSRVSDLTLQHSSPKSHGKTYRNFLLGNAHCSLVALATALHPKLRSSQVAGATAICPISHIFTGYSHTLHVAIATAFCPMTHKPSLNHNSKMAKTILTTQVNLLFKLRWQLQLCPVKP